MVKPYRLPLSKPWLHEYLIANEDSPLRKSSPPKAVQIISYITGPTEEDMNPTTIWALLSDGEVSVPTKLLPSVVAGYMDKHQQRITQAKSGVFELTDYSCSFENVPYGGNNDIALIVSKMKLVGSEGELPFGHPIPAKDFSDILALSTRIDREPQSGVPGSSEVLGRKDSNSNQRQSSSVSPHKKSNGHVPEARRLPLADPNPSAVKALGKKFDELWREDKRMMESHFFLDATKPTRPWNLRRENISSNPPPRTPQRQSSPEVLYPWGPDTPPKRRIKESGFSDGQNGSQDIRQPDPAGQEGQGINKEPEGDDLECMETAETDEVPKATVDEDIEMKDPHDSNSTESSMDVSLERGLRDAQPTISQGRGGLSSPPVSTEIIPTQEAKPKILAPATQDTGSDLEDEEMDVADLASQRAQTALIAEQVPTQESEHSQSFTSFTLGTGPLAESTQRSPGLELERLSQSQILEVERDDSSTAEEPPNTSTLVETQSSQVSTSLERSSSQDVRPGVKKRKVSREVESTQDTEFSPQVSSTPSTKMHQAPPSSQSSGFLKKVGTSEARVTGPTPRPLPTAARKQTTAATQRVSSPAPTQHEPSAWQNPAYFQRRHKKPVASRISGFSKRRRNDDDDSSANDERGSSEEVESSLTIAKYSSGPSSSQPNGKATTAAAAAGKVNVVRPSTNPKALVNGPNGIRPTTNTTNGSRPTTGTTNGNRSATGSTNHTAPIKKPSEPATTTRPVTSLNRALRPEQTNATVIATATTATPAAPTVKITENVKHAWMNLGRMGLTKRRLDEMLLTQGIGDARGR